MEFNKLFDQFWNDYVQISPSAKIIRDLFLKEGETIVNDHVAFRTFNHPSVNVEVLAEPFKELGYVQMGKYNFPVKNLFAKHYEIPGNPEAPRVFISELLVDEFSDELKSTVERIINRSPEDKINSDELILSGRLWGIPSYQTYEKLREESEYAAWMYVFGFRPNHFTISINNLKKYNTIEKVNVFLKEKGYKLNSSGGEIKGSKEQLLEQSSTLAELIDVRFREGVRRIPSCYYEFAMRYPDQDGNLFSGFIAKSADKIFESTDFYKE